jgi:hypothetical protein
MAKPPANNNTTTNAKPATLAPEVLERAQAKHDALVRDLATHEAAISAARTESEGETDADRLHVLDIEIARHELKARATKNALKVAELELTQARGALGIKEAREAAVSAAAAQTQLKVCADNHVRALAALFKTQRELAGAVKEFDATRKRALQLCAATGQPAPKLHSGEAFGLACAFVRDAQWTMGVHRGAPSAAWCTPRATLADVLRAVRQDLHMQRVPELQLTMSEEAQLRALLDDTYRDARDRAWADRAEAQENAIRSSEELERQRAEERKAEREASRRETGFRSGIV